MSKYLMKSAAAIVLGLAAAACSHDFDVVEKAEQQSLDNAQATLGFYIPENQDWKMSSEASINVAIPGDANETYTVMVYANNPLEDGIGYYLTKQTLNGGQNLVTDISYPAHLESLVIGIIDSNNMTTYKSAYVVDGKITTITDLSSVAHTRSGNTGGDYVSYPSTHQYTDAYGNMIASANMNHNEWADPDKEYGGWIVPDPLTEGQKLRVQKYFQANPNLSYQDPHYANFFVQQVYTGGTSAPETGNKESTVGADGQAHKGMTLNQLTVGTACSHINDFNAGTCSPSQVLDNGSTVNNGTYHSDQITLMVNVDDTSCFGYHETSGSNVNPNNNHNDKMALVSAATIDAWAAANGNPGEAVVDKWNRSFMGFDYELLPESDIVEDSYALLSQVPNLNNMQYAWDGEKVMVLGTAPEATEAEEVDITSTFAQNTTGSNVTCSYDANGNIVCVFTGPYYNKITFKQNADWSQYDKLVIEFAEPSPISATLSCEGEAQISVGDTKVEVATVNWVYTGAEGHGPTISNGGVGTTPLTLTIKSVKLVKEASAPDASIAYYNPTYLLGDAAADKIAYYSRNTNMYGGIVREVTEDEMKTTQDGKTCLNLKFFQDLVDEGYHPITTDLKTWVKWQAACDGYYSDWIVTLTEAQRITPTPPTPTPYVWSYAFEDNKYRCDFDMNDVVLRVNVNKDDETMFDVTLVAAGCEYDNYVFLGDQLITWPNGSEVHDALGAAKGQMVNTGRGVSKTPVTVTIARNNYNPENAPFKIWPYKTNGMYGNTADQKESSAIPISQLDGKGKAPLGIIVPGKWAWPTERTVIVEAYSQFVQWASETDEHVRVQKSDWYNYPTSGKVVVQ